MADIFISYKSERRPAARHLKKVLNCYFCGHGDPECSECVWYDYGLLAGKDFEPRLMAELAKARVVVVLWCGDSVASRWVHKEAREAIRLDKYFPIRIESCALPEEFKDPHTLNLTEWDLKTGSTVFARVWRDLAAHLGRNARLDLERADSLNRDVEEFGATSLAHFFRDRTLTVDAEPSSEVKPAQNSAKQSNTGIRTLGKVSFSLSSKSLSANPATGEEPLSIPSPPHGTSLNLIRQWENARAGNPDALYQIAFHFDFGKGNLAKDEKSALLFYRLAADRGHAAATNNLGVIHALGQAGQPIDEREAVRLYRLAADRGYAPGQGNLAGMYHRGRGGLRKDLVEAARLYRLGAEQGDAQCQANLGSLCESGAEDFPQDTYEAVRLYKLAADQRNATGQSNLGRMHALGAGGLPVDEREAVRLFKLAADQGNAFGQGNLGFMYLLGRGGLPQDERKAVELFKLSADQGDPNGQNLLGTMYARGAGGLPENKQEATRLFELAAKQGNADARANLVRARGAQ